MIKEIEEYVDATYEYPRFYDRVSHDVFKIRSINLWAVEELIDHIWNSQEPVMYAIMDFRDKMDIFACAAHSSESNEIFSTAFEVATDLLDFVICEESME